MNDTPFTFRVDRLHWFGKMSGYIMFEGRLRTQKLEYATQAEVDNQVHLLNATYQMGFNRGVIALDEGLDKA